MKRAEDEYADAISSALVGTWTYEGYYYDDDGFTKAHECTYTAILDEAGRVSEENTIPNKGTFYMDGNYIDDGTLFVKVVVSDIA